MSHTPAAFAGARGTSPPRVVLTFDDAVKSHHRFVAPLLKDLGFRATFFVTRHWMADTENFMTWEGIAEIHETGFEIGNHSCGCPCFHADPVLPDCAPGGTVRVKGRLWFYTGQEVEAEVERAARRFARG